MADIIDIEGLKLRYEEKLADSATEKSLSGIFGNFTDVNIIETATFQFDYVEQNEPEPPAGIEQYPNNAQSVNPLARGQLQNSLLTVTNGDLDHACHLYVGFGNLSESLGLSSLFTLPPSRIQASIQLRLSMSGIFQELRKAVIAILDMIGLSDTTGIVSEIYSEIRKYVRQIKKWTKEIRQIVSDALALSNFIMQVLDVVLYLLSLPARFLAVIASCITGFLTSVASIPSQLATIPGVLQNATIGGALNSISSISNKMSGNLNTIKSKSPLKTYNLNSAQLDTKNLGNFLGTKDKKSVNGYRISDKQKMSQNTSSVVSTSGMDQAISGVQ